MEILLNTGSLNALELASRALPHYSILKFPERAVFRDLFELIRLSAVSLNDGQVTVDLDWPRKFSESELLEIYEGMPSAASASHPAMSELSRLLGRRR